MSPIEAAQPFWRVAEGGPAGLTEDEQAALARDLAPPSWARNAAKGLRELALGLLGLGALLLAGGGICVLSWLLHALGVETLGNPDGLTDALYGIVLGGMALAIGLTTRAAAQRGPRPVPLHRREGVVTGKRGAGATAERAGALEYRVEVDDRVELRLQLGGSALFQELQEGSRYRFWFTAFPGAFIVYVTEA